MIITGGQNRKKPRSSIRPVGSEAAAPKVPKVRQHLPDDAAKRSVKPAAILHVRCIGFGGIPYDDEMTGICVSIK